MAVPTNTFQTYQAVGNREDLADAIYNVTPYETPLLSMAKKTKATATLHEWQTEALGAVDSNNAVIEGDDATNDAVTATARVVNHIQISDKVVGVTTIQQAVDKAGRKDELAHQMVNKGLELRRDMETILCGNQARVVGAAGTAQKLRGLEGWYVTNDSRGVGGADGNATTAATDGTQRNFTEALFKAVINLIYTNASIGPNMFVMAGPANRANLSSQLSGGGTKFYRMEDKKLVATISVYDSDFGALKLIPNRFQRDRTMHFLNPEYIAVAFLEKFRERDLAVTGLADRKHIWSSYTLEVRNEAAHGVLADLNTAVL